MEQENKQEKIRCRKCLLREMDQDLYFSNLHEYIAHLDEEVKASAQVYEKRLEVCKACDYLEDGMCKACGCFVELRAAIKTNYCSYNKW